MDTRYPWLVDIKAEYLPGLTPPESARARAFAVEVNRRARTKACWNAASGTITFYRNDPGHTPPGYPFKRPGTDLRAATTDPHDVDEMVLVLNMAAMARKNKDREKARWDERDRWNRTDNRNRFMDGVRPGASDYAAFLSRRRRGTAKVTA